MKHSKNLVAPRLILLGWLGLLLFSNSLSAKKSTEEPSFSIATMEEPTGSPLNDKPQDKRANVVILNSTQSLETSKKVAPVEKGSVANTNKKIKVVVDAGHGGRDIGAQGLNGVSEKDLCLKISRMVRREIERFQKVNDLPIEVVLSRNEDAFISLRDRVRIANEWGADLFVSIHANSSPVPKAHGFEVYFLSPEATDEEASKLARLENQAPPTPISAQVISILSDATTQYHVAESSRLAEIMFSAVSRKILSSGRGVRQAPFTVLHGTNMPAVLIEVGYLTHAEESKNLSKETYLKRIASAISSGIIDFASKRRKL